LNRTLDCIRPAYVFDVSCQGSVPEAIIAFLESTSYEDALRNAVSLGGDSDTIACMAGGIAEAYYGEVPSQIVQVVRETLTDELWTTVEAFYDRFPWKR
jgi:ADP-ribosylglycohydrolase